MYVSYTTVQIVYDLLPHVLPGERGYQTLLALLIPVAMAAVMIAGRGAALLVIGLIAAGQMVLAGVLDGVTVAHLSTPASSFGLGARTGSVAKAGAQTSLLYICGSLPLFLGGGCPGPPRRSGADCWARLPSPAWSWYWRSRHWPPRRACCTPTFPASVWPCG